MRPPHGCCAFYVFYNARTDELLYAGTAEDLVDRGYFPSISDLRSIVSRIKSGKTRRYAVVIEYVDRREVRL
jgi:hypothetical protein